MAYQLFGGSGPLYPPPYQADLPPAFTNSTALTGSTELYAWSGPIFQPGMTGTKNIDRIEQICFGPVTKAGGSGMTLSIQGVLATTGVPMRPDGVIGQSVAIANSDAGFVSNSNYTSGLLSSTRAVSQGDLISIVLGYDGAGRLGADSVVCRGLGNLSTSSQMTNEKQSGVARYNGTTWAQTAFFNNAIVRFTDGSFASLTSANWPGAVPNTYSFSSTSVTRNEMAAVIRIPFDCQIDALYIASLSGASADYDVVLYNAAGSALVAVTVDASQTNSTGSGRWQIVTIPITNISKNVDYYVAIRPSTANALSAYTVAPINAAHLAIWPGNAIGMMVERLSLGAWSAPSTTEKFLAGYRLYAIDIPTGGGAVAANPLRGFI